MNSTVTIPADPLQPCRCPECGMIHQDFIAQFGKWPNKTHDEGQALKRRREDRLEKWDRHLRPIESARREAAVRNARNFGTDPSWYGQ